MVRKDFGGMNISQLKRHKELDQEKAPLRKAVSSQTLDKLILKETAEGIF